MASRCMFNYLAVGCWNIEGVYEKVNSIKVCKLNDISFQNTLNKFDILCLQETHLSPEDIIPEFKGYVFKSHCRKISGKNRYFGGIFIFIRESIKNGVKVDHKFDEDALEITYLKNFFGLDKDIKNLFTYASPINSCYTKSRTMNVLDKIETTYIDGGNNLIIMGDLNGRTKLGEDFVRDKTDNHSPINVPSYYSRDTALGRKNMDEHVIDTQGKVILELCKSSKLRILNGRTPGDDHGGFTRFPSNFTDKPSVIDYALCSEPLMNEVLYFSVLPFTGLSDHCCISLKIKANVKIQTIPPSENRPIEPGKKVTTKQTFVYDKSRKHVYEQALNHDKNIETLKYFFEQEKMTSDNIDVGISKLNDILVSAAKKSGFIKRSKLEKKHKTQNTQNWFTKECKGRRDVFRQCSKKNSNNPFDRNIRKKFIDARAAYKKICRKSEKSYRHHLTKKLMEIGQNEPKLFWKIVNQMNNWGKKQTDLVDKIPPDKWISYFKELLNDKRHTMNKAETFEFDPTFDPILDSNLSSLELREALASLKTGKASGPDGILTEYLKIFGHTFETVLLKILRCIFVEHIYPSQWTVNFLKPIYKKGNSGDPDNYRGIAIGSALAKLFSIILLNRLTKYINQEKLISVKQIGFMKGTGTSDHIFLLQTIIEKVVRKGRKRLYAAFIDFKKAYDTVDRDLLIRRLKSLGINGIFLRNIIAMYKRTEYSIKFKKGNSQPVFSSMGLKQGCPLSPMLFNLYIDDIDDIYDESCSPVEFQDTKINHFLYADDLVLLSLTSEGLQNCLDRVHNFAKNKRLTVSTKKSKTMIFNQAGIMIHNPFVFDNEILEQVQSFCYLGFDVKCSGTVKHAMNVLRDKANKALRPLLGAIARFDIPVRTSIRLFHSFISPILLYNSENWFTLTDKKLKNFSKDKIIDGISVSKIDITHRKLLKFALGVSKSCPNLSMYGETGEIPISFKSYRLALNFWYRVTNLPDNTLVKKALLENIRLRTNWIMTIEKLIDCFNLSDKIGNHPKFKRHTKIEIDRAYIDHWTTELSKSDSSRLNFYKDIKGVFKMEKYLHLPMEQRRAISKIRCSDHHLEIEKGRHKNIPRSERKCRLCSLGEIETEQHFLLKCDAYNTLRKKYETLELTSIAKLFNEVDGETLGNYLVEAFTFRKNYLDSNRT